MRVCIARLLCFSLYIFEFFLSHNGIDVSNFTLHIKDPAEVIKFCKECVLSEDEEPCDIPETIFRDDDMGMHP